MKRNWPNGGARWKNFPNWPMTLVKICRCCDKSFNVWDKSLQDASKKSPFLFPNGVQTDAYVNSVGIFLKMAKDSGEVFKNNMLDFGRAAQQGTQAIVKNGHAPKRKAAAKPPNAAKTKHRVSFLSPRYSVHLKRRGNVRVIRRGLVAPYYLMKALFFTVRFWLFHHPINTENK